MEVGLAAAPEKACSLHHTLLLRYLDREAYLIISTHSGKAELRQLAVNTAISTGRRHSIPQW